jgi:DNA-binding transcriptional LysR family regulator
MEDKLDVVLLDRTSQRVALTPAGDRLIPAACAALDALGRLPAAVEGSRHAGATLCVGFEAGGLAELNGPALDAIAARLPSRRLEVREILGPRQTFGEHGLDLALVRSPVGEDLVAHPVAREERGILAPPGHPAAEGCGGLRDVAGEPFVAVAPHDDRARDYWLGADGRAGREPVIGGAARTLREMVEAVGHLGLLTTGCRSMLRATPMPGAVFARDPALPDNEIALALRREERRPEVLALVEVVRDVVAAMDGTAPGITAAR